MSLDLKRSGCHICQRLTLLCRDRETGTHCSLRIQHCLQHTVITFQRYHTPVHLQFVDYFFSKLLFRCQDWVHHSRRGVAGVEGGRRHCTCPTVYSISIWFCWPPPLVTVVHSHLTNNTEQGEPILERQSPWRRLRFIIISYLGTCT